MTSTIRRRSRSGAFGSLLLALTLLWPSDRAGAADPAPSAEAELALAPDSTAAPSAPAEDGASANSSERTSLNAPGAADGAPPAAASLSASPSPPPTAPAASPAVSKPPTTASATTVSTPAKKSASKTSAAKAAAAKSSSAASRAAKPPAASAGDPPPAASANGAHPDSLDEKTRARREVGTTDAVLRSVKTKVTRSFNKKARDEFEKAFALQKEARDAMGQNLFARADRLTLESRTLAREIAIHLGPPQDDPDYVSMTLDRTDDALKRAKEVLQDADGTSERARLSSLEERQKEARRLHKDGSVRDAYAATRSVRDGVLTLLRDCDDLPVRPDTAERALKRASRALEQAKGELGEKPTAAASRLARDARAQYDKARTAFARKNYRDTLLYSKLVERDLELAVSAQRGSTSRSG